ncbi:MAG: DUF4266 domain-containing protein [Nitrospirota bacterium]
MNRTVLCLGLLCLIALTGCAEKLIMVQPYEMEHFAQDKMRFTPLDARAAFEEHIYSIREASAGGSSGFQGGCGCR